MAPFRLQAIIAFLGAHLVLGVAGLLSSAVATAHAAVVVSALLFQVFQGKRLDRLLAITAYGALSDVYWRTTQSRAPWELSKYLLVVGSLAILIRFTRTWQRSGPPIAFLLCLVPGILITVLAVGVGPSRELISDSEMGVISIGLAALAFRQVIGTQTEAWNLGWLMLGPVATALAITTWSTLTTSGIQFNDESNFAVTGGYGPNQVSTILGLGILISVLLAFQRRGSRYLAILVAIGLWCTWAAFLTFSRGGIYSLVFATCALLLVGVSQKGARVRSLVTLAVGVVGLLTMFASVNSISGNWLDSRYQEDATQGAGRRSLVDQDIDLFLEHPMWGVGTGQSPQYHTEGPLAGAAAHTEFARLGAEKGIFGLAAIGIMVVMLVGGFRAAMSRWNRLLVAGAGIWAASTMLHAATRLAAVSLLFALTQLRVEPDGPESKA